MSQFADDTSIILDGSEKSCCEKISEFGKFSWQKINIDKTQVVQTGSKNTPEIKYVQITTLKWGISTFNMLGIECDVD